MDFADLKRWVEKGVQRADLDDDYGDFVNEALKEIQRRRSWTAMKDKETLVISSGDKTAAFPEDFKELQRERNPVNLVTVDGGLAPVDVVFEEQEVRRLWAMSGTTFTTRAYLYRDGAGTVLGLVAPAAEDLTFQVKVYKFLPALSGDGDENPLTVEFPWMIIEKAKALALMSINDPQSEVSETAFEKKYAEAARRDAYSDVSGLTLRM